MRKLSTFSFATLACASLLAAALAHANGVRAAASATASPAASPSAVPSPVAVVHIKEFKYNPTPLTVHVGDTVEFIEDDRTAHTVTASDGKSFDSGNMDQGATWYHTFDKAGTFNYVCAYHSFMTATVIVKAAP